MDHLLAIAVFRWFPGRADSVLVSDRNPLQPYTAPEPGRRPGQFPTADALARHTLKLPVPHDDDGLTECCLAAFDEIWTHRHDLKEGILA